MRPRQRPRRLPMSHTDRQRGKPLAAERPLQITHHRIDAGSRPLRCFVASSHAEAALTKTSFAPSPIAARPRADKAVSPASHHSSACVSSGSCT